MERRKFIDRGEYLAQGSEGEIWENEDGVYKEFKFSVTLVERLRKEKLLLYLEKLEHLKQYYPNIKYLVDSLFGLCMRGYVMSPVNKTKLSVDYFEIEEVLDLLGKLRNIIDLFKKEGLYYFDIREPNIRVLNGSPLFLDIDSLIMRDDKRLYVVPSDLEPYLYRGGKIDENAQIVMFNLFTMNALGGFVSRLGYDSVALDILRAKNSGKLHDSAWDHEYFYEHVYKKIR